MMIHHHPEDMNSTKPTRK